MARSNPWIEVMFDGQLTRLRPTSTTDPYGNQTWDWSSPASLTVKARYTPPILKPRLGSHAADEDMAGRDAVRYDLQAWVSTDDFLATDRVVIDGLTYEIMGAPGNRTDLDGNYLYTKLLLRAVTG